MEYIIRKETEADYYGAELVAQRAFWNKHYPGCNEHLLVHNLRMHPSYVPELTRLAEYEGRIVGAIYYARAYVDDGAAKHEVLTFGPLCVDPDFQGRGIGGRLLEDTLALAREMGFKAAIIFGEPDYYPLHGFSTCDKFDITTPDGKNFSAFMGIELISGALDKIKGRFFEPDVYDEGPPNREAEEYDRKFPYMEKKVLPGQWK